MSKQAVKQTKKVKAAKPVIVAASKEQDPAQQIDRHEKISVEAYLRAEQRGFQGGDSVSDWLGAEVDIDLLAALNTNT